MVGGFCWQWFCNRDRGQCVVLSQRVRGYAFPCDRHQDSSSAVAWQPAMFGRKPGLLYSTPSDVRVYVP